MSYYDELQNLFFSRSPSCFCIGAIPRAVGGGSRCKILRSISSGQCFLSFAKVTLLRPAVAAPWEPLLNAM